MSFAFFDPDDHEMTINATPSEVKLAQEADGTVTVTIVGLDEGIEIVEKYERRWRPVP